MNSFHVIASLMIFLLWTGWVPSSLPGMAAAGATRGTAVVPLVDLLKADGSLDFSQGYRGSVDTQGWALVSAPDEAPRFAPQAPSTIGDEIWADDFTVPGFHGSVYALALGQDGAIYVGGSFDRAGGVLAKRLARWHPDTGWTEVGGGVNESVYALALDGSGRLYVGGWFTMAGGSTPVSHVTMWDGGAWSDLAGGVDGPSLPNIYDFLVDGNDVYVAGSFNTAGGIGAKNIAKWDGAAWSPLGNGTGSTVFALDMDTQGSLYAGGSFSTAGGVSAKNVAKWDGVTWSTLGSGLNERVFDIAVDSAGNVVVAGGFTQAGGQPASSVAYWDAATATWSNMAGGTASGWADAVLMDAGGQVYVGGRFIQIGGVNAGHIARWNGSVWVPVGGGMNQKEGLPGVQKMAWAGDGSLVAIGAFNTAGGINANGLARWDGARWTTIGKGVDNTLGALYVDGDTIYAGVILAGGENVDSYLLQWNGVGWTELGGGANGSIQAITLDGAGNLYIGGWFNRVAYNTDNMVEAYNIAMWNGTSWSSLNSGTGVYGKPIYALAVDGSGNLYAGGEFDTIGGVAAKNIAKWNGSAWSALGDGVNDRVYALLWDTNTLYVGGAFTQAGGSSAKYIARWDGADWADVGGGTTNNVMALAREGDALYAGGWFTTAGGKSANYIARWQGGEWFALGEGMNNRVGTLAVASDGTLYAGGQFSEAGGQSARGIARWAGGPWSGLGSGVEATVNTLAFDADENLYIGGYFTTAGGKPSSHIAYARLAPSLTLTKAAAPAGVMVGGTITYTLVAQNVGASPATGLVLTDTVPADSSLNAASLSGDATNTGVGPGSLITWNTGADLAPGEAITRTFVVQVTGGVEIANTGYVRAANVTGARHSNRVQTPVWTPSLTLTKGAAEAVQPGHALAAHLILHNDGTMPLTGVILTDTLPAGTTFASASHGGTLNGPTVTWQVGDLAVGATVTRTCTVDVPGSAVHGAPLINTAGVVSDQGATATASKTVAVDALAPTFPTVDPGTGTPLISPTLGAVVTTTHPAFHWHGADGTGSAVLGYTLIVTASESSRIMTDIAPIWTTQTSYTLTTPLTNGAYTWSVRAHDEAENVSSWTPPASFRVSGGSTLYLPLVSRE